MIQRMPPMTGMMMTTAPMSSSGKEGKRRQDSRLP
jgi:hypothetical protein